MKIKIECNVDSLTVLAEETEINHNNRIYKFIPNEEYYLSKIEITCDIDDPEKFASTYGSDPSDKTNTAARLVIKEDSDLLNSVRKDFQELESLLSFTHSLERIHWDKIKYDFIFENEQERIGKNVYGFGPYTYEYAKFPKGIDQNGLQYVVESIDKLSSLAVSLAYFREAMRDQHEHRYINSFFNLYYILEGFYGGGKWRNHEVGNEFRTSELAGFLQHFIDNTMDAQPGVRQKLTNMLAAMNADRIARNYPGNFDLDVNGIIELIIDTRGSLHHYNQATSQGTPFNHQYYKEIQYTVKALAIRSLLQKLSGMGIPIVTLMRENLDLIQRNL